jgi:hypothetical protein
MNKFTKKEFLISKYQELKQAVMTQEFAQKFNDLLPSLEEGKDITDIILFIHLKFVGKNVVSALKTLLNTHNIDLAEHHIHLVGDYINEFLQFLELVNML